MKRSFAILLLLFLLFSFPAAVQTRPRPEQARPPSTREAPAPEATAPTEERFSSTSHVVHVNGREIRSWQPIEKIRAAISPSGGTDPQLSNSKKDGGLHVGSVRLLTRVIHKHSPQKALTTEAQRTQR